MGDHRTSVLVTLLASAASKLAYDAQMPEVGGRRPEVWGRPDFCPPTSVLRSLLGRSGFGGHGVGIRLRSLQTGPRPLGRRRRDSCAGAADFSERSHGTAADQRRRVPRPGDVGDPFIVKPTRRAAGPSQRVGGARRRAGAANSSSPLEPAARGAKAPAPGPTLSSGTSHRTAASS